MVCLGVTGEAARLTDSERYYIAQKVIQDSEGLPVTVGTTADSTAAAIARSKEAESLGAGAVMVSPPSMGKPNPEAVIGHYSRLADAINIQGVVIVFVYMGFHNFLKKFQNRFAIYLLLMVQ